MTLVLLLAVAAVSGWLAGAGAMLFAWYLWMRKTQMPGAVPGAADEKEALPIDEDPRWTPKSIADKRDEILRRSRQDPTNRTMWD